jgi:hypothetical protein
VLVERHTRLHHEDKLYSTHFDPTFFCTVQKHRFRVWEGLQ